MKLKGWRRLDIVLVTGDTYIDSPFIGVAVIGNLLASHGFRVGVIAQPDVTCADDIQRLGEPELFWGVTGGCVDSMVANFTPLKKRRKSDDYTPGGINNRRPDRAVIAYTNLIRHYFKPCRPILLGGIEASLRRIAHYDFWSNRIRRSILFDAKADYLISGMAHNSVVHFAQALKDGTPVTDIKGLAYIAPAPRYTQIPSFEKVLSDPDRFINSFSLFYQNQDPLTATGLCQKHNDRYLVLNPPEPWPSQSEMDAVFDLDYERDVHPFYSKMGPVKALDTIRFAIPTHQGCYGECHFCAITVHQGRTVRWRSEDSIVKEAGIISKLPGFKGYILDLGGPTANMYGFECRKKLTLGACNDKRCLFPRVCSSLDVDHSRQLRLLERLQAVEGIKKIFIASGIRHDLIMADRKNGAAYLDKIVRDHVSGQLKIAPEHTQETVLELMGKAGSESLVSFKQQFDDLSKKAGKKQFLTYYLMAAHPGCTESHMSSLKAFTRKHLKINPAQVQIFTPTPSTYSTLMYCTGKNPFTGKKVFVEKDPAKKERQKKIVTAKAKAASQAVKP